MAEEKAVMVEEKTEVAVGEELVKATVQEMLEDGPVLQETLAVVDVPTILPSDLYPLISLSEIGFHIEHSHLVCFPSMI